MKERKIPLSAEWLRAYQEYNKQYPVNERLLPWSPRRLEYILEDLGKDAGVEKHISFDMCRWTCAHLDWKNGNTAEAVRQKLGISKIQWREVGMKLKELAVQNP
jgi:integrase/recombinase XerD